MFTKQYEHTILHNILKNELTEIADTYKVGQEVTNNYYTEKLVDGHVLVPISPNKQSIQDLITSSKVRFAGDYSKNVNFEHGKTFIDDMKGSVVIIDKRVTVAESIDYIVKFIEKAGNNFYGAVLRDDKGMLVNPLHPLFTIAYLDHEATYKNKLYKLHLYFYPNRAAMDRKHATSSADKELIQKNLEAILKAYASEPITKSICTRTVLDSKNYSVKLEHRTKVKYVDISSVVNKGANMEYYLSAQQVLTRGIYFPYYGTSIIRKTKEGQGEGMPCTPFLAVNIGRPGQDQISGKTAAAFTSICTGSQPRNTLPGIRSLTHANLSSAMNSSCFLPGCLAYADASINLSLSIYHKAEMTKELVQVPTETVVELPHDVFIQIYLKDDGLFTTHVMKSTGYSVVEALELYNKLQQLDLEGHLDGHKENYNIEQEAENDTNNAEAIANQD